MTTISKASSYDGCVGLGKVLNLGDTVTSEDDAYVLKIVPYGLTISFDGGPPQSVLTGLVDVKSVKLTPASLIIYTLLGGPYVIPLPLVAVRICVEDNGQVVVFDAAGNSCTLFSYNNALALVSASALAALEASLSDMATKVRVLKETVRPVLLGVQDEKEVPTQSGFPGANDSAGEKVA